MSRVSGFLNGMLNVFSGWSTVVPADSVPLTLMFYVWPIVFIFQSCLVIADTVTNLVVFQSWWQCDSCQTWAIIGAAIYFVSIGVCVYRLWAVSVESESFAPIGLHGMEWWAVFIRVTFGVFQVHHLLYIASQCSVWFQINRAGSALNVQQNELVALHRINDGSIWFKGYMAIFESFPMLCLQVYILFLTRNFTAVTILSCFISLFNLAIICSQGLGGINGERWWSIAPTRSSFMFIVFTAQYVGGLGMRICSLVFFCVAFPTSIPYLAGAVLGLNLLSTFVFIFCPIASEVRSLGKFLYGRDPFEASRKSWFVAYIEYGLVTFCTYALTNLFTPQPGMAAAGLKWRFRHVSIFLNMLVRSFEVIAVVVYVLLVPNTQPCSGLSYLDCDGCCRGPLVQAEVVALIAAFFGLHIFGLLFWWPSQSYFLSNALSWNQEAAAEKVVPLEDKTEKSEQYAYGDALVLVRETAKVAPLDSESGHVGELYMEKNNLPPENGFEEAPARAHPSPSGVESGEPNENLMYGPIKLRGCWPGL